MRRGILPLAVFVVLLGVLGVGLTLHPRDLPSPLIGRAAPSFRLPVLQSPDRTMSPSDLRGRVWVLNVWASWCVECRRENAAMVEMAKLGVAPIYGLNYKDRREDALDWLSRFGDPYIASMSDTDGLVGIDYGVYGVPETYVIDKAGVIRLKLTGPLTPDMFRDEIMPLVARLSA